MKTTDIDFAKSPTAWFSVLERAKRTNDFRLAAEAQDELKRLGVVVRFSDPEKSLESEPAHDA